jgi:hypothetical protein
MDHWKTNYQLLIYYNHLTHSLSSTNIDIFKHEGEHNTLNTTYALQYRQAHVVA